MGFQRSEDDSPVWEDYDAAMGAGSPFIRLKLNTNKPVEMGEFVGAFTAIADEYDTFVRRTRPNVDPTATLFVKEVQSGSVEAILIPMAIGALPLIENANVLADLWSKRTKPKNPLGFSGSARRCAMSSALAQTNPSALAMAATETPAAMEPTAPFTGERFGVGAVGLPMRTTSPPTLSASSTRYVPPLAAPATWMTFPSMLVAFLTWIRQPIAPSSTTIAQPGGSSPRPFVFPDITRRCFRDAQPFRAQARVRLRAVAPAGVRNRRTHDPAVPSYPESGAVNPRLAVRRKRRRCAGS
jgi:hypothetical protein